MNSDKLYADYEKHGNIAPGIGQNVTRTTTTVGTLSGIDRRIAHSSHGDGSVLVGLMAGSHKSHSNFSDSSINTTVNNTFLDSAPDNFLTTPVPHTITSTEQEQSQTGILLGAYTAFAFHGVTVDALASVDISNVHQKAIIRDFSPETPSGGCSQPFPERDVTTFVDENVSLTDYVIAANVQRRYDLGGSRWWEPTVGFRFTYSDFGGNAVTLGLKDGHILRLQGGVRVGHDHRMKDHILTTSLGAFLYSDVLVEGFTIGTAGLPVSGAEVDEGKLRAMGQVNFKIDTLNGWSYYWQGSVRGGEDLFGATGKVGIRREW